MAKTGVVDDLFERVKTKGALTNFFMTVFMAFKWIFAVVNVNGKEAGKADDLVKLSQNAIQIMDYVISGIVNMAGIETDTYLVRKRHIIHDPLDFLKGSTHFAAFTRHGFKENNGGLLRF